MARKRRVGIVGVAVGLAALLCTGCRCGHGKLRDHSRVVSAVLSDDGRTAVFSYQRLRYRPASGFLAFPDGGVPRYEDDEHWIGVSRIDTGESRILVREENEHWAPGNGAFYVQQVVGSTVLVGQGGQREKDLAPDHRSYLLDIRSGRLTALDLDEALAERGRGRGTVRLVRADGLLVIETPSLAEAEAHLFWRRSSEVVPEIWVRHRDGRLARVAATRHYAGFRDDGVFYWQPGDRLHRRYDVASARTEVVPDPRFGHRDVSLGIGIAANRRGLEIQRRRNGSWVREPLEIPALR